MGKEQIYSPDNRLIGITTVSRGVIVKITEKTIKALHEVLAYERGEKTEARVTSVRVDDVNVKVLRKRLRLSQQEFADLYGFQVSTLKNWEQGRRVPEGPARLLLRLIASRPDVVAEEIRQGKSSRSVAS